MVRGAKRRYTKSSLLYNVIRVTVSSAYFYSVSNRKKNAGKKKKIKSGKKKKDKNGEVNS